MKLRGKLILLAVIALSALLVCAGLTEKPPKKQPLDDVSEALFVDVTDGTVLYTEDSHGGFHGDGLEYMQIQFSANDCLTDIENSPEWQPLPLPEDVAAVLHGGEVEEGGYRVPLNSDAAKEPCMPRKVENGYYYFLDRYAQDYPSEANTPFLARFSWNFTLALYDTDTNILYYVKYDS